MNSGGPAFPFRMTEGTSFRDSRLGLTKREWFAGMALAGWLAAAGETEVLDPPFSAEQCFKYADAMLAEAAKAGREG